MTGQESRQRRAQVRVGEGRKVKGMEQSRAGHQARHIIVQVRTWTRAGKGIKKGIAYVDPGRAWSIVGQALSKI
jgi:hypothetical protein